MSAHFLPVIRQIVLVLQKNDTAVRIGVRDQKEDTMSICQEADGFFDDSICIGHRATAAKDSV
jgi:hypothetical protein